MKNVTSKVLAATLLTLAVAGQSAMAMSQGPSGFEQVVPGSNAASVIFDNHSTLASNGSNQGASGYDSVLPGHQEQVSNAFMKVSYTSSEAASNIIDAFDTTK